MGYLYFNIQITTPGTDATNGPYDIFYDITNLASLYSNLNPTSGLTYSTLSSGVQVRVPDTATLVSVVDTNSTCTFPNNTKSMTISNLILLEDNITPLGAENGNNLEKETN